MACPDPHRGLVVREAKRWRWATKYGLEQEDLVQAGYLGVCRAMKTYNPKKGAFTTYAVPWIRHFIRRAAERTRTVFVSMEVSRAAHAAGEPIPFEASQVTEADHGSVELDLPGMLDKARAEDDVRSVLLELPDRQRDIIMMRHWQHAEMNVIAERLGISTVRATKEYAEGLRTLRLVFDRDELEAFNG